MLAAIKAPAVTHGLRLTQPYVWADAALCVDRQARRHDGRTLRLCQICSTQADHGWTMNIGELVSVT
jgi:hypothetical protein